VRYRQTDRQKDRLDIVPEALLNGLSKKLKNTVHAEIGFHVRIIHTRENSSFFHSIGIRCSSQRRAFSSMSGRKRKSARSWSSTCRKYLYDANTDSMVTLRGGRCSNFRSYIPLPIAVSRSLRVAGFYKVRKHTRHSCRKRS